MRGSTPATIVTYPLLLAALLLGVSGCGTRSENVPGERIAEVDVVQVTTLTTVQASSGSFLSPTPRRDVPDYVARGQARDVSEAVDGLDRAEIEEALLFRSQSGATLPELRAELRGTGAGEWSPIEHYFPAIEPLDDGADWPIELSRGDAVVAAGASSEWSGWQAFGGLGVSQPGLPELDAPATAAVATLDFEVRGAQSPLVLETVGGKLTIINRSAHRVERALLIYSHAGGVGVTSVSALGPGERVVTFLGPKERPQGVLLELARAELRDFFGASVGDGLGAAIAESRSIPFLETQGLRLIALLDEAAAPTQLGLTSSVASHERVVVSHSEILKPEEESQIISVVADESLDVAGVASKLGRFSEGKLEYAATGDDDAIRSRAQALLGQLRGGEASSP